MTSEIFLICCVLGPALRHLEVEKSFKYVILEFLKFNY